MYIKYVLHCLKERDILEVGYFHLCSTTVRRLITELTCKNILGLLKATKVLRFQNETIKTISQAVHTVY